MVRIEVERVERHVGDDPVDRGDDAGADVAAVAADLVGDQREQPLRVRLSLQQRGVGAELGFDLPEAGEDAVVGEEATVLLERVRVLDRLRPGRGEADVGEEARRALVPRLAGEGGIVEGRDRRLVDDRSRALEDPEARPVGIVVALVGEAVGRFEQPDARAHRLGAGAQSEQATHLYAARLEVVRRTG